MQLPTGNGHIWEQRFISHVKAYGGKVIIYLHRSTYQSFNGIDSIGDTIFTCNHQGTLIVESFEMMNYLADNELDDHVNVLVRENGNEILDNAYYIGKVLDLALEAMLTDNKSFYQLIQKDTYREKKRCEFSYYVARVSCNEHHAVSYKYEGDADGFVIWTNEKVVWETDNLRCHYALIDSNNTGGKYRIGAYVYTLKGRMIVASTDEFAITEPVYYPKEPKISLIIPAYNAENLIVRAIDAALGQSQEDIELIIVDDGSLDHTSDVVDWYVKRYENVHILRRKNGGVGSARNTGIDFAHGEYIAFMDSDDILPVNALKSLYDAIVSTDADVSVGRVEGVFGHCRFNKYNIIIKKIHLLALKLS